MSAKLTRRSFVQSVALTGLVVRLAIDGVSAAEAPVTEFGAYLNVQPDGRVRFACPQVEIGQGAGDALARIIAEELDADWSHIDIATPRADPAMVSPRSKRQRIANSESVLAYWVPLRQAGATARTMLVQAAANRWGVESGTCSTEAGVVLHTVSGRRLTYGAVAVDASKLAVPTQVALKDPAQFRVIGKRSPRLEARSKSTGEATFAIDVALPDMLVAALKTPNVVGGAVKSFDAAPVLKMPGVVAVVAVDGGVAVIADHYWNARKGADALAIEVAPTPNAQLDSTSMRKAMLEALQREDGALPFPDVDTQSHPPKLLPLDRAACVAALDSAPRTLDLVYEVPYLAHQTMEPMTAVALVSKDECRVWAAHQQLDKAREVAAELAGLPLDRVHIEGVYGGGGFGRRWELDYLRQVVQAAKAVPGRPVKLIWTREQDTQHDFFRPGFMTRTKIGLDEQGIVAMHSRIAGQSVFRFQGRPQIPGSGDPSAAALLIYDVYDFKNKYIDHAEMPWSIPVGLWRSVTLSQNTFFAESAIDEAAHALKKDPYRFRRALLERHTRLVAVLDAAAKAADWNAPLAPGRGRGIAFSHGFESLCAQVAEVERVGESFRVVSLTCAFDCGRVISPSGLEAQLEGGMLFGLSAALHGGVTFREGCVQESNFLDQPIVRMSETPRLRTVVIESERAPGGAGEAAVPCVAPAIANALAAAGGPRLRRLPLLAAQRAALL